MTRTMRNSLEMSGTANSTLVGCARCPYSAYNTTNITNIPTPFVLQIGAVIMTISLLLGVCASIVILLVIFNKRELKNIINIFIMSLCINDIINLCITNLMVLLSYYFMEWPAGALSCEMVTHFSVILMGTSLWHTALIAIHRLIVVVFNQCYRKMSKKTYTIFVLVFARIVPLVFLIQPKLGKMADYEPRLLRCLIKKEFSMYKNFVSIVIMAMPTLIVIVCYIIIFLKVHASSSRMRTSGNRSWLAREIRITKMFGFVFLVILLGYLPYGITRVVDQKMELSADIYVIITVIFAVANCCNPLVYGIMDLTLRKACLKFLGCDSKCCHQECPDHEHTQMCDNGKSTDITHVDSEQHAIHLHNNRADVCEQLVPSN